MPDELLEILDDILDNGTEIPPKVSNRMLLAAVRKNYRVSSANRDAIDNNLVEVRSEFVDYREERARLLRAHIPRIDALEKSQAKKDKFNWIIVGAAVAAVVGVLADIVLH